MPVSKLRLVSAAALLAALALPASADELKDKQYVFDIGVGALASPRYPGSDETMVIPYPLIAVGKFFVPGIGNVSGGDNVRRLSIYPSFNFIGKRDASKSNELEGMKDVDWALEAGLGIAYRYDWIRGFAEVRQGFNGYSGQVADFGVDFIATPTEDIELMVGPRASWGSKNYMETYFGITGSEAAESPNFDQAYEPDAGFNKLGIAANASYKLTDTWTLHGLAGWDRMIGEAADSPIVQDGSENQFYGGAGLSYRFGFNLN